jgi:LAS superfamily LD-carboxypeptidase LdcB
MNPREWTDHYDCTVQVGLGTGNQDQRLQVLQQVLNVQEKMIQQQGGMGMVTPQTIYNTIEAYLQNSGYKDATQFFNDPSQQPPQPPQQEQQDPALQLAAQQIEIDKQKAMADVDFKNRKLEADNEFKMQKLNLDEQKLATQVVKEQKVNNLEKEKLASKILQQGMN